MKTAGVIAEYNPFHNGHKYQLDKIRQETGADYIIVAMSGDFLQRGVPAMMDKYRRTRMALSEGADLVLEIPVRYATASAEFFAKGGVNLLAATGVVDVLCYGCETKQPHLMKKLVSLLTEESPRYQKQLRNHLAAGEPFPAARAKALHFLCNDDLNNFSKNTSSDFHGNSLDISYEEHIDHPPMKANDNSRWNFTDKALDEFLASPNNILALEYEKALALLPDSIPHKPVSHPILRVGSGYHSRELFPDIDNAFYASATAIRTALDACGSESDIKSKLSGSVPPSVLSILCEAFSDQTLLTENDFSEALYTRLWACRETGYESFADCSRELSGKIKNHLDEFVSFTQFAKLLKSRDVTYTRVCRVLTHIMLGITRGDVVSSLTAATTPRETATFPYATTGISGGNPTSSHATAEISPENRSDSTPIPYLRVLGFRKSASGLLSAIKKEASVPLITKVSDASRILTDEAYAMLQQDIRCADLYRGTAAIHSKRSLPNEYTQGLVHRIISF